MKNKKNIFLLIVSISLVSFGVIFYIFIGNKMLSSKIISYAQNADNITAINLYNLALKITPESASARNKLIQLYVENESFDLALLNIEQGIIENPDNDDLYFYKIKISEHFSEIESIITTVEQIQSSYVKTKFSNKSQIEPYFNLNSGNYSENIEIELKTPSESNIYYKINAGKYELYTEKLFLTDGYYHITAVAINDSGLVSSLNSNEYFVENLIAPVIFTSNNTINSIKNQLNDDKSIDKSSLLSLIEIDLSDCTLFNSDIETLLNCTNLTELKLGDISNVTTIYPLTKLENLQKISVESGCSEQVLKEFLQINSINSITINNSKINILPKNTLILTHLTLKNCLIYNITNISSYKTLEYLDLSQNYISDINGIEDLKKINFLNLSNNKISDISYIFNIISIKSLDVSNNKIIDIKNMSNLLFLEKINISNNEIASVLEFSNLRYLNSINCSFNNILTLEPLVSSQSITEIYANDNIICDISYINSIENLNYINLANNQF